MVLLPLACLPSERQRGRVSTSQSTRDCPEAQLRLDRGLSFRASIQIYFGTPSSPAGSRQNIGRLRSVWRIFHVNRKKNTSLFDMQPDLTISGGCSMPLGETAC